MPEITDEIRTNIRQWIAEGCGLSELQTKLNQECGQSLTYMDVRFMVLEMGLEVKDKNSGPKPVESAAPAASPDTTPDSDPTGTALGSVSVELSPIARPGSLVSGTVSFSDGMTADWSLDQMGQLGLAPRQPDYRPSESDIQAFQTELKKLIAQRGF